MLSPSSEAHGKVSEDLAEFGDTSKKNSEAFEVAKDDLDGSFTEMDKLSLVFNCFNKSNSQLLEGQKHLRKSVDDSTNIKEDNEIWVSEDFKKYALRSGFQEVPMNEATLTSLVRMAMSMGNGDMAFDMVKQTKPLGINPRLRSYGSELFTFCNNGDIEKAFGVEERMLEHGVYLEKPSFIPILLEQEQPDEQMYSLAAMPSSLTAQKFLPNAVPIGHFLGLMHIPSSIQLVNQQLALNLPTTACLSEKSLPCHDANDAGSC